MIDIKQSNKTLNINKHNILLINKNTDLSKILNSDEVKQIKKSIKNKTDFIDLSSFNTLRIVVLNYKKETFKVLEQYRISGSKAFDISSKIKADTVNIYDFTDNKENILAFSEGFILSSYQFLKYFSDADKKSHSLKAINLVSKKIEVKDVDELKIVCDSVFKARDLVNEPSSYLTAEQLAEEIKQMAKQSGFNVEVFGKKKIESLKMGGLLAVNKGSIDHPTFSILSWKPDNAKNEKPYVLVGKGVVFDTGGLSLKPTAGSMDEMKSDMAGAASVAATIKAIAEAKLPVYVIGLIPATDNRPGQKAYAPQDVIKMHNGLTVEVLNTDAEGRMILADALSYAQQYKPELVIDLATLTGAAWAAIGQYGIVGMGNADKKTFDKLKKSGENTYERIVEFPFWEEYDDLLKSDIADLKNIGGKVAGAITAGKFLEHFTNYKYIHLDIAGPAYIPSKDYYRSKNATGVGVRLLFNYFKNI